MTAAATTSTRPISTRPCSARSTSSRRTSRGVPLWPVPGLGSWLFSWRRSAVLASPLPSAAHAAHAQDDPDCVEPSLDIHKWTNGFVTNSSPYTLCGFHVLQPSGRDCAGRRIPTRPVGCRRLVVAQPRPAAASTSTSSAGATGMSTTAATCCPATPTSAARPGAENAAGCKKPGRGWNADVAPDYVLLVDKVLHCNASGGNCVWAEPDAPPLVALYDKPDYKIPARRRHRRLAV